jgi:hypothetical protein
MTRLTRAFRRAIEERALYTAIALALCVAYLAIGVALPVLGFDSDARLQTSFFGVSQLRFPAVHPYFAIVMLCAAGLAFLTPERWRSFESLAARRGPGVAIGLAALAVVTLFTLRTNFINRDGAAFAQKFMTDIPVRGAHVTHDEMLELYVHSRFWFYSHAYLGWSVERSYQVLSCLAGGIFVVLLLMYCRRLVPDRPALAFLLCISGGFMQLFFGDVENYTLTATCLMGYFLGSALFLEQKVSILAPSVLLAVAAMFHLLALVLVPSLLYLYALSWRSGERRLVVGAICAFCVISGSTLLFFHTHGLPLSDLWYKSHAFGQGGHMRSMLVEPSIGYYFAIANLALLLVPAWVFVFPLLVYDRITLDSMNVHLLLSAGGMAILVLCWRAQLGVYDDWNLFASAALPVSFLVWRNVLNVGTLRSTYSPVRFAGCAFMLHSYSWVAANHFR